MRQSAIFSRKFFLAGTHAGMPTSVAPHENASNNAGETAILGPNDESWLVELSWSVGVQTLRLRIALRTMTPLRAKERTAASAAINRSAALR
jgi:hypothetical protein